MLGDDLTEPSLAHVVRSHLGLEVPVGFVSGPDVVSDQGHDLVVHLSPSSQLDRGNPKAFLEDLCRNGRHASGRHASHVHVVREVGQEGYALALGEHGRQHADVRQMGTADVGVVRDDRIPGFELFDREMLQGLLDDRHHQSEVEGDVLGLRHEVSAGRVDCGGAVPPVLDVRRQGGPDQCRPHLLGNGLEAVSHYLQGDRVRPLLHALPFSPSRMSRFP